MALRNLSLAVRIVPSSSNLDHRLDLPMRRSARNNRHSEASVAVTSMAYLTILNGRPLRSRIGL